MFNPSVTLFLLCFWLLSFLKLDISFREMNKSYLLLHAHCFSMWRHPKPDRPCLKFEGDPVARVGIWEAGLAHWVTPVPPFTALDSSGPDISRTNVIIMDIRSFFKKKIAGRGSSEERKLRRLMRTWLKSSGMGGVLRRLHSVQKQPPLY